MLLRTYCRANSISSATAYQLVSGMQVVPVTRQSIAPLLLAAVAPLALVAATRAPIGQVLGAAKGLLLL